MEEVIADLVERWGVAAVRDSGVMSANSTRVESTTLVPNILF